MGRGAILAELLVDLGVMVLACATAGGLIVFAIECVKQFRARRSPTNIAYYRPCMRRPQSHGHGFAPCAFPMQRDLDEVEQLRRSSAL